MLKNAEAVSTYHRRPWYESLVPTSIRRWISQPMDSLISLPRATGFKVALNRVCNVDGVCAACHPGEDQFGTEDLEGVVKSNILMVEMARSARPKKK